MMIDKWLETLYNIREGWKVCRNYLDPVSLFICNRAQVRYRTDEWVQPEDGCGPLCIFSIKNIAVVVKKKIEECRGVRICYPEIFPCLYLPSPCFGAVHDGHDISQWYELPVGTELADCVMIYEDEKYDG